MMIYYKGLPPSGNPSIIFTAKSIIFVLYAKSNCWLTAFCSPPQSPFPFSACFTQKHMLPITPKFYHRHNFLQGSLQFRFHAHCSFPPFTIHSLNRFVKPLLLPFINPFDNRKMVCSVSKCDGAEFRYRRLNKQRSIFPSSQALKEPNIWETFEIAKK